MSLIPLSSQRFFAHFMVIIAIRKNQNSIFKSHMIHFTLQLAQVFHINPRTKHKSRMCFLCKKEGKLCSEIKCTSEFIMPQIESPFFRKNVKKSSKYTKGFLHCWRASRETRTNSTSGKAGRNLSISSAAFNECYLKTMSTPTGNSNFLIFNSMGC